jgi:hypothetical protein
LPIISPSVNKSWKEKERGQKERQQSRNRNARAYIVISSIFSFRSSCYSTLPFNAFASILTYTGRLTFETSQQ